MKRHGRALALVMLAAVLAHAQAADPVKVEYDERFGVTLAELRMTLSTGGRGDGLALYVTGTHDGKAPRRPELVTLSFYYTRRGAPPRFKTSRRLTMWIDGREYPYGEVGMYRASVKGGALVESMTALVTFESLQDITTGEDVRLRLGDITARLTPAQLRAVRALAAKFEPQM